MKRRTRELRLMWIMLLFGFVGATGRAKAAQQYRFSAVAEGAHSSHVTGMVVVDGTKWRINYDPQPDTATDLTALIGTDDGQLVALYMPNHTWFRLSSRKRLAADSSLFRFGDGIRASKVRVAIASSEPDRSRNAAGRLTRVTFSYRIDSSVFGERVRGEVKGELRVSTAPDGPSDLPWRPCELASGIDSVDHELAAVFAKVSGVPWQCEIEVSRRLENGETLRQVTRRSISEPVPATAAPSLFVVPPDYRYQEPVIGRPGGAAAR